MKQFFAGALLLTCLGLPASASSIVEIDETVTGPLGSSIITLGNDTSCDETACVDASGGAKDMMTGSAGKMSSLTTLPENKINFEFARKFPDPAVPIPAPVSEPTEQAANPLETPKAPADSGEIAAQPPVEPQPGPPAEVQQSAEAPAAGAPLDASRGSIDPTKPVKPIRNIELREGE